MPSNYHTLRIFSILMAVIFSSGAASDPQVTLPSGAKVTGTLWNGAPAYFGIRYAEAEAFKPAKVYEAPADAVISAGTSGVLASTQRCFQYANWMNPKAGF